MPFFWKTGIFFFSLNLNFYRNFSFLYFSKFSLTVKEKQEECKEVYFFCSIWTYNPGISEG
jgi:hypothetical protein